LLFRARPRPVAPPAPGRRPMGWDHHGWRHHQRWWHDSHRRCGHRGAAPAAGPQRTTRTEAREPGTPPLAAGQRRRKPARLATGGGSGASPASGKREMESLDRGVIRHQTQRRQGLRRVAAMFGLDPGSIRSSLPFHAGSAAVKLNASADHRRPTMLNTGVM